MRRSLLLALSLLLAGLSARAQVSLRLLDEAGEPLYGVNAYTPDYGFTASSDLEGRIDVPALPLADTLTLSYTGYQTRRLGAVQLLRMGAGKRAGQFVELSLKPASALLDEVVVVGRTDEVPDEIPWTVAMIGAKDIAATNPQTTADALEDSGEVFVQRSQMGGGSPVVRGFEANRVLLVVDGVRLNNAIYRSGHLQSAITVDPAMLDRVEVLFGAGSLLYGSDALGGVVHFVTREPRLALDGDGDKRSGGHYFARFSSANLEKTAHLDYNLARKRWAAQTSLSVSSFADLRAGTTYNHPATDFGRVPYYVADAATGEVKANPDPYVQRGTGYDQIDLMQKVKWQLSPTRYLLANAQYSNSSQVPRFDRLTQVSGDRDSDLKFAEWYYGPQRRLFGSLRMVNTEAAGLHDRAQWIAAYQRIDEDRYDRKLDNMWRNLSLVDVGVASLTFDADKYLGQGRRHRLSYGFEAQHNDVSSLGGRVHLLDGSVLLDQISRYPSGGAAMTTAGAYLTHRYSAADERFHTQAGLRYTAARLAATFGRDDADEPVDWPAVLRAGITSTNSALTYAAGFTYAPTATTTLQVLGSTSFRSPNVDDFGKMRVKNGFVSVPNPALSPERAVNAEATLTQRFGDLRAPGFAARLSATAYASRVRDIIVRADGALPNGDTTFTSGNEAYRVQVNTNADEGVITGLGLRADFTYGKHASVEARTSITRGVARDAAGTETPLAHIPPTYGHLRGRYQAGWFGLAVTYRYNAWKRWEDYAPAGSSDNEDQAIDGVGTPAWSTVDVHLDAAFAKTLRLQAGVENIADLHYRPFSSGVSAPGRNFVLSLRGEF